MEALQTATRNPARYFGKLSDMGTIEPGKLADLVLLYANPLDDIRNTRKISLVVLRGRINSAACGVSLSRLQPGFRPARLSRKQNSRAGKPAAGSKA